MPKTKWRFLIRTNFSWKTIVDPELECKTAYSNWKWAGVNRSNRNLPFLQTLNSGNLAWRKKPRTRPPDSKMDSRRNRLLSSKRDGLIKIWNLCKYLVSRVAVISIGSLLCPCLIRTWRLAGALGTRLPSTSCRSDNRHLRMWFRSMEWVCLTRVWLRLRLLWSKRVAPLLLHFKNGWHPW